MIPINIPVKVEKDPLKPKLVPMKVAPSITPLPLKQDEKVIHGKDVEEYEGPYTVHPSTEEDIRQETVQKYMRDDVVVEQVQLQAVTVIPSKEEQIIEPDSEYDGLSQVSVEAIPSEYIIPTGTIEINNNGQIDIAEYQSAQVDVEPQLQDKTVTPTEETQIVTADGSGSLAFIDQVTASAKNKLTALIRINQSRLVAGQLYHVTSGTCHTDSSIGTDYFKIDTLWIANPSDIPFVITSNSGVSKNQRNISMSAISNWENANIVVTFTSATANNSVTQVGLNFETLPYDGQRTVTVEGIDPSYIGSAIPRKAGADITPTTQAQMAVPNGYYTTGDVTVLEIPYFETSNPSGGYTVYIGG